MAKRTQRNKGELPKFYVEDTHPAIVSKEVFDAVTTLLNERDSHQGEKRTEDYPYKKMVFCGCCGWRYQRKKNYKKYVWRCGNYTKDGPDACSSKQIPDDILCDLGSELQGIRQVIVLPNNQVKFISETEEIIKPWQYKSRSESWTDEMKETARRKQNAKSN